MDDGATLRALADRQAIADLVYRYCRAIDRIDADLGHTIWHEGATADYGAVYRGSGRGLIDFICESHRGLAAHSHQVTNLTIAIDGDRAGSEAYATVVTRHALPGGAAVQTMLWVRYLDRCTRRGGRWAIDARTLAIDMAEQRMVEPLAVDSIARRDRDDPSYAVLALRD